MRQDTFCFLGREVASDYGNNKYDNSEQKKYFDRVIDKEIKGICKPRAMIETQKTIGNI